MWNNADEIDFDALPDQFVLKCTHDSEGLVIVKDKKELDIDAAKEKLNRALNQNFYYIAREWQYKDVKPRIIAEQYMEDHVDGELRDYKFFCFDGVPKLVSIMSERDTGHLKVDYFDMNFDHVDLTGNYPNAARPLRKPDTFDEMIRIARTLSKGFAHMRVDLYEVNGKVYFGELTFYHHSGFAKFTPKSWDKTLGDWIHLPMK